MNNRTIYTLAFVLFLPLGLAAQFWSQSSLWTDAPLQFNPASAGQLYSIDASLSYRKQWNILQGAPETAKGYVGAPLYYLNSGVSLGVERDALGLNLFNTLRASYAYNLVNKDDLGIAIGLGINYTQRTINGDDYRTATGIYEGPSVDHRDPLLATEQVSGSNFGLNGGVEVRWQQTYVGISALNIYASAISSDDTEQLPRPTYIFCVRSLIPVLERIEAEVMALAYSDGRLTQATIGTRFWYDDNIGVGAALKGYSAQTLSSAAILLGWRATETLTLGYAYEFGLSELEQTHDGSHEVVLRYRMSNPIGKGELPPIIFNPRP